MRTGQNIFSVRLRTFRIESGLSQQQVGERLGKKRGAVSSWENGTREPSLEDLAALAGIFGRRVDELMGAAPEGDRPPPAWVAELMPALRTLDSAGQEAVRVLVKGLAKGANERP